MMILQRERRMQLKDNNNSEILIYQSENGKAKIDVRVVDETVWLTQAQLCELYQSSKANVSSSNWKHINVCRTNLLRSCK